MSWLKNKNLWLSLSWNRLFPFCVKHNLIYWPIYQSTHQQCHRNRLSTLTDEGMHDMPGGQLQLIISDRPHRPFFIHLGQNDLPRSTHAYSTGHELRCTNHVRIISWYWAGSCSGSCRLSGLVVSNDLTPPTPDAFRRSACKPQITVSYFKDIERSN